VASALGPRICARSTHNKQNADVILYISTMGQSHTPTSHTRMPWTSPLTRVELKPEHG
jgi:hypothetical protein